MICSSVTTVSNGYFEYRYYCAIRGNNRIKISMTQELPSDIKCLNYLKSLNQTITTYTQNIKSAQQSMSQDPQLSSYWNNYLDETQPKLLQSRILYTQITKAMEKFEENLFEKTMIYVKYRFNPIITNLSTRIVSRQEALQNAIKDGDEATIIRINDKYNADKRKLDTIKLMIGATNFSELMPFYTTYQKGEFEY